MRTPAGRSQGVRRPVAFTRNLGSPFGESFFVDVDGGVVSSVTSGSVAFIAPVPESLAYILFLAGLGLEGYMGWRNARQAV